MPKSLFRFRVGSIRLDKYLGYGREFRWLLMMRKSGDRILLVEITIFCHVWSPFRVDVELVEYRTYGTGCHAVGAVYTN